jgi:cell division protein FtsX
MATLVVTIVTPDTTAMIADQLQEPTGSTTLTNDSAAIDRIARYVDGVATGAFGQTSVTIAIS